MHQKNKEGGGESTEEYYQTWTIQICPSCEREVKESYEVVVIKKDQETIADQMDDDSDDRPVEFVKED